MKSHVTAGFRACFNNLPERIRRGARKNYKLWKNEPLHPSLFYKHVGSKTETYSIRVGIGWRALGVKEGNTIVWFWFGSHADYDRIIQTL